MRARGTPFGHVLRGRWIAGLLALSFGVPVFFLVNWCYQVTRKPAEIVGPLDAGFYKTPEATWAAHGASFRIFATDIIPAELLAALAQTETRGNPIARTYWTWRWSWNPFRLYAPASSATGLFQITDGTFREASRYCIRGGKVLEAGPFFDLRSCWFNGLYNRLLPSHATELTSAYLHVTVMRLLAKRRGPPARASEREDLAAIVHLCGPQVGARFAAHGFRLAPNERCGDQDPRAYLARVRKLEREFAALAKRDLAGR